MDLDVKDQGYPSTWQGPIWTFPGGRVNVIKLCCKNRGKMFDYISTPTWTMGLGILKTF